MAQLLATSPIVYTGRGSSARRITLAVIRNDDGTPREFVVQSQNFYEDGSVALENGNWMPVYNRSPQEVQANAWKRFQERANELVENFPLAVFENDPVRYASIVESNTIETGKG